MVHRGVSWRAGVTVGGLSRWRRLVVCTGLLAATLAGVDVARATEPTQNVTLRVEDGVDPAAAVAAVGGVLRADYASLDAEAATIPASAFETLRAMPGVMEVTPESAPNLQPVTEPVAPAGRRPLGFVDGDHGHGEGGRSFAALDLTALARIIDADRAQRTTTGSGIDIALIDTGVAPVDGVGRVVDGPDLSFDGEIPGMTHLDGYGHGTHLAGIINGDSAAARGLAPDARIVNVRVGSANGAVDVSQVIAAIDWVVQHRRAGDLNIRVLVLAYGTDGNQPYAIDPLAAAVEHAWKNGIVVVSAAGNRGSEASTLDNPALDPWVIAVGASETNGTYSTADDSVAPFTNRGSASRSVDLLAPGRSVVSLRVAGSFVDLAHPEGRVGTTQFRGSGTSQAAAVVGASVALILADRPQLTPDDVKWLLTRTARRLPHADDQAQGAGVIDVADALRRSVNHNAAAQNWPLSDASGTLEGARGSNHVIDPTGALLHGEIALPGGATWTGTSWSGTSWSGTSWSGTSWSGTSWSGGTWLGTSWSGTSWSGTSWSGTSWSGTSWSGTSWSGTSWSGTSWSGTSWSGTSWSSVPGQ
jgi:serine protease AprX